MGWKEMHWEHGIWGTLIPSKEAAPTSPPHLPANSATQIRAQNDMWHADISGEVKKFGFLSELTIP